MDHYDVGSLLWQAFFAVAMFFATFISYLLPIVIFIRRRKLQQESHDHRQQKNRWKRWLSYCNCISAGVFLGVCFLSLVPCVENEFDSLIKDFPSLKNLFGSFSVGQFSIICGLFLVLFLENFLSSCFNGSQSGSDRVPVLHLDEETIDQRSDNHEEELLLNSNDVPANGIVSHQSPNSTLLRSDASRVPSTSHDHNRLNDHHHHGHHHLNVDQLQSRNDSMFSFFILMFATSVHSLFEGMALGLQTNLKTAIHLFIGIILHECLVALALGLNAVRLQQDTIQMTTHLKFATVFSLNIPLGNLLGILIGYTPGHIGRFVSAIFQGFAAGTFIHVTFFELIPEEFIHNGDAQHHNHNNKIHNNHQQRPNRIQNNTTTRQSSNDEQLTDIDLYGNGNVDHDHANHFNHNEPLSLKLRKISLLFVGFLLMALIAFSFSESE
ncbi:zinc transporter ZIP3 isoform X2 [Dermatophagoides farinae]|uniref:zinc transporter ZIP3 isoform X2 n=1 Tax=Dermatophagoides farinae TaxID=6954 RepID=UPI001F0D2B6A|nr:zinc transporter ZIP3-like isoform X2 [Dermatophagoides farinae]